MTPNREYSGDTTYPGGTPGDVASILDAMMTTGRLVRLFYGDPSTGVADSEDRGVVGYIGRSRGSMRVPLILEPVGEMLDVDDGGQSDDGGSPISTHRLVRIVRIKTKKVLYTHGSFDAGRWAVAPPRYDDPLPWVVSRDGEDWSRFLGHSGAEQYIQFMTGKRFSYRDEVGEVRFQHATGPALPGKMKGAHAALVDMRHDAACVGAAHLIREEVQFRAEPRNCGTTRLYVDAEYHTHLSKACAGL